MRLSRPASTFRAQARALKSLAHPTRLAIVQLLAVDEACVCHLSAALRISQPSLSQHLMVLRRSRLVRSRRQGKNIYYSVSEPQLPALLDALHGLGGAQPSRNAPAPEDCPCPRCQSGRDPTLASSTKSAKERES